MAYVDAATTNILSPDIFHVKTLGICLDTYNLNCLLQCTCLFLQMSTLHFYQHLNTHVLIVEGKFFLLINVPIYNRAQQLQIYEVFSLQVPHGNLLAQYKINPKYTEVTYDVTNVVMIMDQLYRACQHTDSSAG